MRYYIDTSLLVALVNEKDHNHETALKIVPKEGRDEKVISKLVIVELYSVYSRRMSVSEEELEALVNYTLTKCGCKVEEVDFGKVMELAITLSGKAKLKTLDLLHLSASKLMSSEILSLDKEIMNVKEKLKDS
ncbi:type II toxin-antitoxin system VapC family toxin [Saccharolobus islandicus]|uniref:PilT protein domain protein n=2 Tax=Saccharolobus islandicus TaxID=43080 RepID=C4KGW3_SACI6|nr:type II toxin-antitoxin system VapC family toxin [Sulfolobus islandicus]ACP37994.1 PilT protein domain protein [Sulfolobus islandicus M.14.25]ACR41827.1 PilT protein domain protein [Sulfolobus islandicus M.16.4]